MLLKSRISKIEPYTEFWHQEKLGKLSSSEISKVMEDNKGMLSYIYRKVGEELTGVPAKNEIQTEATVNGHVFEPIALREYAQANGIKHFVESKLIHGSHEKYCSTPDGLVITAQRTDVDGWDVWPVEAKCPLTYEAFISLYLCETPFDILKVKKDYFWQLMDQIDNCGSLQGIFVVYHPDFVVNGKRGLHKAIPFRIMEPSGKEFPLKKQLDFLRERKKLAVDIFEEVKAKILNHKA